MRTAAHTPASPVPSNIIVAGSGVIRVPVKVACELELPKFAVPIWVKVPVIPSNKPVPPITVKIFSNGAIPPTGGSVIDPATVPIRVLPLPKSKVKRPFEITPVATLPQ